MAQSGSSSSSFASSSLGLPPYARTYTSPVDSTWTPSSAASTVTSESSAPPTPLRPLDLGPPGYQATITLFERLPNETTVYLGPWETVGSDPRRVLWQCSYQGETLEQFLPTDVPSLVYPLTLHARHRPYSDPGEMELYLTFREAQRIRYTGADGAVIHDEVIEVKYEFTSIDASLRFQGDLRRQELVDYFDVDVIWSDTHSRTDNLTGAVRGLATIQRMKLWRDSYSTFHYFTFYSNRPGSRSERRFREYAVTSFEAEVRGRDDRHRQVRLNVRGRRGSAPDNRDRRFSISSPFSRQRQRSVGGSSHAQAGSSSSSSQASPLDIRYLSIQFSRENDYRRFLEQWVISHSADSEFRGVPFPPNHFELPSPQIPPNEMLELPGAELYRGGLSSVPEPIDDDDGDTPPA